MAPFGVRKYSGGNPNIPQFYLKDVLLYICLPVTVLTLCYGVYAIKWAWAHPVAGGYADPRWKEEKDHMRSKFRHSDDEDD